MSTTTTSLTELVNSEYIDPMIMEYAHDYVVVAPFVRQMDLRGKGTNQGVFPRWVLDAALDVANQTAAITLTELESTEVTITGAEVGVARDIYDPAVEETILGDGLFSFLVQDAGLLLAISLDDDLCALFSGASTSVGSTGANLSLANMVEAQAQIRKNKMRGQLVYILDDQQASDYQSAQAASTATTVNSFFTVSPGIESGFLGSFMNAEVWQTGLCDTANTGADVVGACFIRGDRNPRQAALGMVMTRDVRTELVRGYDGAAGRKRGFFATAKWGVGETSDESIVSIITDA